jgi:multiple sugar transport system substrate-binding protein
MASKQTFGRRDFLKLAGMAGAGATLAACAPAPAQQAAAPAATTAPAAGATSGLSPDTTATITIFNFGGAADQKVYAEAEDRFKKRYPNVTIVDNFTPVTTWSEYTNKVATQVAGGKPPDIINIAIEGAALLQSKGLLMPLDNYMNNDPAGKELIADVHEALIKPFQIKGSLWLLPHSWNNMVVHYNTKIFEDAKIEPPKPDWTWDDFLETAKALTTGEGDNKVWGFAIPYFNFGLHPWWLTNGTYQLSDDWTKSNLDDPKMLESVTFVRDLVHKHKVSPDVKGADNNALFTTGKVAMSGWGHWPIQTFLANNFKDFAVQYFPRKTAGTSVFGVGGWGIYPQTKNADLSWELIKELTSKETIDATAKVGVAIPARRSVAESKEFLEFPPNSEIFYGSLNDAKPVASPANFTELETIFMRHMDEIMTDAVTPEAGLKAAHEELSAAMAKLQS